MPSKRSPLPVQVLLFLLGTLLAIAIDNLTGLEFLRQQALPLAVSTVLLIIGVMIWQYRTEQRLALPLRPAWDSDRLPFPGLEAFTEQDSAVFFGRDSEITELLDRLHPVVPAQVNRLVVVVGPSGAGKSSLVQAGVVPRLRHCRGTRRGVDRRCLPAHRRSRRSADPPAGKVVAELGGADGPVLSTLLKFVTIGENEPTAAAYGAAR